MGDLKGRPPLPAPPRRMPRPTPLLRFHHRHHHRHHHRTTVNKKESIPGPKLNRRPTATGSAIPPPAWSTSPACCLQNGSASPSRTWTPASTNGATTSADVPSTTAGATTTAPRRSRRTCGSANSRTGCRKSPSQSLKTPCIQRPDYRASTTCPSSASSMNTSAHQASPSTPTTPVSAPRSRPSACWPMHLAPAYRRPNLPVALETGSCLTMTGPSRQVWTHQIKRDQARPRNERRLSLTFRSVLNQDGVND